jgi:DNA-binding cell septation regulator SpoVG
MGDEISSIFVTPLSGYGPLKALASLNYRGVVLRGLRVMETDNSKWLGMPARKKDEQYEDYFFFPEPELRKRVSDAVLEKYNLATQN